MDAEPKKIEGIGKIKSGFILEKILSLLYQNKKFDLIAYNKQLQNKLRLNLEDYIELAFRFKLAKKNGKGKEYLKNTDIILFEGEYLNGKRHGKGKEYYENGELIFEGEYLNEKRWNGKGKEYWLGNLSFEGEYLNGKKISK